jgi:formylglycine-generating enzyme required for sulfatase activity
MRYAWGNGLTPGGEHCCNIWQGTFPTSNSRDDGHLSTAPVIPFRQRVANGYGLYEMAGNGWEWCADWFLPKHYTDNPQGI